MSPSCSSTRMTRHMHDLSASDEFEAAASTRDQLADMEPVLLRHRQLAWLRTSPSISIVSESGVVELGHGLLRLPGDETSGPPVPIIEHDRMDELLVVARSIDREVESGRAGRRARRGGTARGGDVALGDPPPAGRSGGSTCG